MERLQTESDRISNRTIREIEQLIRQSTPSYTWFENNKPLLLSIMQRGFSDNRNVAAEYLHTIAEEAGESVTPTPALWNEAAVWASFRAMGPAKAADIAAGGLAGPMLIEAMLKQLHGSLYRHLMNGQRNTIHRTVDRSRNLIGFRRVSRTGTPCYWCAMLIGRGAVYKSSTTATRSSGARGARRIGYGYHDHDKCGAEPLFVKDIGKYDDTLENKFSDLWGESGAKYSGKDAINAFREAYADYVKSNPGG